MVWDVKISRDGPCLRTAKLPEAGPWIRSYADCLKFVRHTSPPASFKKDSGNKRKGFSWQDDSAVPISLKGDEAVLTPKKDGTDAQRLAG